jgi:transposase-like protein
MEETRNQRDEETPQEQTPDLPLTTKAGIFLGIAGAASLADVFGHWGITGLALGGFTAFALAKTSPQIYEALKKHCGPLPGRSLGESGQRTVWERLTNQYPARPSQASAQAQEEQPAPHDDVPMGALPGAQRHVREVSSSSSLFAFSQVLTRFTPSLDRLFLAVLPDDTPVFCAASDLCHVALAGATDGGKSSILRLLLSQLCHAGASVLLLNPHYTRYDLQADPPEDWTPFERYLVSNPMECRKYDVIEFYLKQIAEDLLPKRLEQYAHSKPLGKPYFLAIEELPAIVAQIKQAPEYLAKILREGRKVGIFLVTVAQDFLVSTIAPGGGGAVRDCYRTAYYVGGDGTTAKVLLDVPVRVLPESELGRGTVLLRSSRVALVKQARLARVPYVDNQALYRLLGPSTYVSAMPTWERVDEMVLEHVWPGQARGAQQQQVSFAPTSHAEQPQRTPGPTMSGSAGPRPVPARLQQVAHVYEPGMSLTWLAGQLGVSEQKAYTWLREAKARGLIEASTQRRERLSSEAAHPQAHEEQKAPSPAESLTRDERNVLEAYRKGLKSGNAIVPEVGLSSTRVNQILNKLSRLHLIDWQPRKV